MMNENPIHAQELLNALEQNPWKTYIEVLAENGKVAIDEINKHLDPELGIQKSVEITGIGGLGKTSVAREYMKRCIQGRFRKNLPYSYYFYYTAKGEMGEVETRYGKENFIQSSGWTQGGGLFVPQLNFGLFLSKICTSLNLPVDLEKLTTHLRENPVLIVLDNFEDVNAENKKKYRDFLQRIAVSATESRVIITSRKKREFQDEAQEIRLRELQGAKATHLIYERYKFLAREHYLSDERRQKRTEIDKSEEALHRHYIRVTDFLEHYVNRNAQLTEGNTDDVVADLLERLDKKNREDVMLNLRHPIMLMRIASLLNSALVDDVLESGKEREEGEDVIFTDKRSVLDILLAILSLPKYGFLEYKRNVIKYIINKAWDSILQEELCKDILEILYYQPGMAISFGELRQELSERDEYDGALYDRIERAVKKIRKHSVFLVEEDDEKEDESVQLLDNARSILDTIFSSTTDESRSGSENIPQVVDLVAKFEPKQTVDNWDQFGPMVQEFCLAVTQIEIKEALGADKMREIEEALYARLTEAKISKFIEQNMSAIVQFIAHANDKEKGILFTIERLETIIQSFPILQQDSIDFLCANWFDGQNRLQGKPEIEQMRMIVMLLSRGVQQNISRIRQLFFTFLSEIRLNDLSDAFDSIQERNKFRNLLSRYCNYVEWSEETQDLFSEFDVELDKLDRFRTGVVGDYTDMEILHHPNSETTDNLESNRCHVCQSDEMNKTVMLFIRKPKQTVPQTSANERTTDFDKWLSNPQTGHPGLSSDAEILAADILAVIEFYDEFRELNIDLAGRGPFSIAAKMKKNFSAYHTNENSATSLAFIIGYRAEMMAIDFEHMHNYMVGEVLRRLKNYPQPNIYFGEEEINAWNNHFVALSEEAISLIEEKRDVVEKIMRSRMRSDQKTTRRTTQASAKQQETYDISQGGLHIPTSLETYIVQMADKPMLSSARFRKELIKRTGGKLSYDSAQKHLNREGRNRGYLNLNHAWIQTICEVIFSREMKSNFSRYSKAETNDLLKEILTSHFK